MTHSPLPLSKYKILDFSTLFPGPLLTLLLNDLGATVFKIESPQKPDLLRMVGPNAFQALNRGKKSIGLDLKKLAQQDSSKQWLHQWISTFDMIVDSHRPGVLEKLLQVHDMDEFRRTFPKLILIRLSAYGQEGLDHLKHVPAHDMNPLARIGAFEMMPQNLPKAPFPVQIVDILSAYSACTQAVAALHKREVYGEPSVVDVSMYDAALSTMIMPYSEMLSNPSADLTQGKDILCGSVPCYNIYSTKEGLISVGCIEPHFWTQFLKILGLLQLKDDAMNGDEMASRIKPLIESKLGEKTAEQWEDIFMIKHHLPISKLRSLKQDQEMLQKEMDSRRMIHTTKYGRRVLKPCLDYVSFLRTSSGEEPQAAPSLGEHNHLIKSKL